jgi:hypothetical protein
MCFYFALTYSNEKNIVFTGIISFIMFILVPLTLVISSFLQMWPCVKFSDKGIEKTFFGRMVRFIKWEDVYEIRKIKTGIAEWLFFSKTNLEGISIDRCRSRKDTIYIVSTKEIEIVIKQFAPMRLLIQESDFIVK